MQTIRKNQSDVVFLFELSPVVGICYENILETYIKPLVTYFYGLPLNDDIGIIKDMNGAVFTAIGYKSLDCTPMSFCDLVQPTSHAKLFYEKLENVFEFAYGANDDRSHMAQGFALALDIFDQLDKRRSEKTNLTRHIILVANLNPYEDIPVFESNSYSNLYYEEILQKIIQKQQINLSIISPKYSSDFIKLYEKVNRSNGEFKLEKINNITYFTLLHKSIHLESYETQQQQQQQQQHQIQVIPTPSMNLNPLSNKAIESQSDYYQPHSIKMETNENVGTPLSNQNYQMNQQLQNQNPNSNNPQSSGVINQQFQQSQQQPTPSSYHQNSPMQPVQNIHQPIVANQNDIYSQSLQSQQQQQQQQQMQQKQLQHAQQIHPQMNQQQAQQQQQSQQPQPNQPMSMNQTNLMQQQLQQQQRLQQINQVNTNQQTIQMGMNQNQVQNQNQMQQPQQQQQQQQVLRQPTPQQIQPQPSPQQQIIQPHTPPVTNAPMNPQQPQPQMMMQNYGMTPSPASANPQTQIVNKQVIYNQQPGQQPVQQASQGNYNYMQQSQSKIWVGQIEWQEKDRNNPANPNKVTHLVKASILCNNIQDPNTGQVGPEVPISVAQTWPPKINIQLLSKQILEILSQQCPPPTKTLILNAEEYSQDLKTALSIGGGLIHLNNPNLEIKLFLVINQGNEVVCKVPSDQNKFLNALKQIIQRQKQQQMQQQQQQQQQQQPIIQQQPPNMMPQQQQQPIQHIIAQQQQPQQRTMMNNPGMMPQQMQGMMGQQQPNQVIIQGGQQINANQINEPGKDLRNLLNVPNQSMNLAQQQQQQQKMQMQQSNQQTWMNQPQSQQQHIQQQSNHQIYMTNQSTNIAQQQQKSNSNFQFYDSYNQ